MRELSGSYKRSKQGSQPGYQGDSQFTMLLIPQIVIIFPPFSYRTGLSNGIPLSQLIDNLDGESNIQLPSNNSTNDSSAQRLELIFS